MTTPSEPLRVIVPAVCPTCKGKKTKRLGFLREKKGSEWVCLSPECATRFIVPTLLFRKEVG